MAGTTDALNKINQNLKTSEFENKETQEEFIKNIRKRGQESFIGHSKEFIESKQEHVKYIHLKKTYEEKSKTPFENRLKEIKNEKGKRKKPNKKSIFVLESQLDLISKVFGKECTEVLESAPVESVKKLISKFPQFLDEAIKECNNNSQLDV